MVLLFSVTGNLINFKCVLHHMIRFCVFIPTCAGNYSRHLNYAEILTNMRQSSLRSELACQCSFEATLTDILEHDEELVFREAVSVRRLLQDCVETPVWTVFHDQDLVVCVRLVERRVRNY